MTRDQNTVSRKTPLQNSALPGGPRQSPVTGHRSPVTGDKRKPWYREPWPWVLFAGPVAVLVGGVITMGLAVWSDDGLVADDYYRRGLAINQTLARDQLAARLGLHATLHLTATGTIEVMLDGGKALPAALTLRLVHPTHAGEDQVLALSQAGSGIYRARRVPLPSGRRNIILEDDAGSWRLTGEWTLPSVQPLELAPRPD